MGGDVGVYLRPHLCLSVLYFSPLSMSPCVRLTWGLCPRLCRVNSLGTSSSTCALHGPSEVPCVPPASPIRMSQGPQFFFLPFFEFLLPGMKGGIVGLPFPRWWAASGGSSVPSSFSVVGNEMSPGPSKSMVLESLWRGLCFEPSPSRHPPESAGRDGSAGSGGAGMPSVLPGRGEQGSRQQARCCSAGKK